MPYRKMGMGKPRKTWKKKPYNRAASARSSFAAQRVRAIQPQASRLYTTHSFKRMGDGKSITVAGISSGGGTWYITAETFQLSDISNSSELTALYDSYRLSGVLYEVSVNTMFNQVTTGAAEMARVGLTAYMFEDNTDATTPTTSGEFTQRANVKATPVSEGGKVSFFLRPRPVTAIYNGVATPAFASLIDPATKGAPFISCDYPGVPHYGLKWAICAPPNTTPTNMNFLIARTYYFTLKDPR